MDFRWLFGEITRYYRDITKYMGRTKLKKPGRYEKKLFHERAEHISDYSGTVKYESGFSITNDDYAVWYGNNDARIKYPVPEQLEWKKDYWGIYEIHGDTGENIIIMNKDKWENMGRSSYGEKYYWQEYSLDEPGSVYILTSNTKPEWPTSIVFVEESKLEVAKFQKGTLYKFALA